VEQRSIRGATWYSDDPPVFSPDGKRVGIFATDASPLRDPDGEFAIIDGKDGKLYSSVNPSENYALGPGTRGLKTLHPALVFSPDSKRVAYPAGSALHRTFMVVDGVEGTVYAAADTALFSPDSRRIAYLASDLPTKENPVGDQCVVLDGKEGRRYRRVAGLMFSPDSRHLVYLAAKEVRGANAFEATPHSWVLVIDGEESDLSWDRFLPMGRYEPWEMPAGPPPGAVPAIRWVHSNMASAGFLLRFDRAGKLYGVGTRGEAVYRVEFALPAQ
jgi:hypothetical protein